MHVHAVKTAYTTTLGAKTAKVSFVESIRSKSTSGSNETATVNGSGLVDLANQGFELQINAPSGGTEQVVETGGVVYAQVPPASRSNVPGNKPWISVDLNQVDEAKLGRSFSQLTSTNSDNPAQALSDLASVSNHVSQVGRTTIGGSAVTEYKAEVSLDKVAAVTKAKDGPKAAQAVTEEEHALGTHTLPVEVWVDSQRLVRRLREQVPIPPASAGTNGSGTAMITITFSAFGTPAPLTPPPASQVADITAQVVQRAHASTAT